MCEINDTYKVIFETSDLGLYGMIPGLEAAMQSELIRVYNIYADISNSGVTDLLNEEFGRLEKEGQIDSDQYNQFMADGYNRLVINKISSSSAASQILDFYVDPEEVQFTGCLKVDHNIKIEFYLQKA